MKKAIVDVQHCVACGTCTKVCPKSAISIDRGVAAIVDQTKCIGCGQCVKVCPACLIQLVVKKDD